jgi:hypothetical protein
MGHFQRIALVDYLNAIGLALPPYKGACQGLPEYCILAAY